MVFITKEILKDKLIKKYKEITEEVNLSYKNRVLIPYKDCLEDLYNELEEKESLESTYEKLTEKMCLMKKEILNFLFVIFLKDHKLKIRRVDLTDNDLNHLIDKLYKIAIKEDL